MPNLNIFAVSAQTIKKSCVIYVIAGPSRSVPNQAAKRGDHQKSPASSASLRHRDRYQTKRRRLTVCIGGQRALGDFWKKSEPSAALATLPGATQIGGGSNDDEQSGRVRRSPGRPRHLFNLGTIGGLTDAELLGRFADCRDEVAELAFAALVERHGPMVLRVCRSILRNEHDAQDAFQATFLILVRRAASVRKRESVASWLHGVALRVSACAR